MFDLNLQNKSVLIIGVHDKLSRIVARSIIDENANVTLIGTDKSILDEDFPEIPESNRIVFDITDCKNVEENLKSLLDDNRKYNGVVFCHTRSDFKPLSFVKYDNLSSIVNDNYFSFVEFIRVLTKMRRVYNNGSVIALSSISSIRAMKAKMAFCSSKAALDAAIRCLAVEFANKKIRFNSIQKGIVDVDFEKGHIQDVTAIREEEGVLSACIGVTNATEIANTVIFLLSDATHTLTGQSVVIDGGYTL